MLNSPDQPRRPYVDISFRLMVAAGSLRRELLSQLGDKVVVTDDYDLQPDKLKSRLLVFVTPEATGGVVPANLLRRWNGFAVEYYLVASCKLIANEVVPARAVVLRSGDTDIRCFLDGENDLYPLVGKPMLMGTDYLVYNGHILAVINNSRMTVIRFWPRPVPGFIEEPRYRYLLR